MTNRQNSKKSDNPTSMIDADTAKGEAPDTDQHDATRRPGLDEHPVKHPTGTRQAQENLENDPPA